MQYFVCTKETFILTPSLEELGCKSFIITNIDSLKPHLGSIEKLINDFNSYIDWNEMFTTSDVEDRIKKGEVIIIAYHNSIPVGYVFTNNGWISNLFVSKLSPKPSKLFLSLSNKVIKYSIKNYNVAAWETEDWNKPMFYVAEQCGCKKTKNSLKSDLVT